MNLRESFWKFISTLSDMLGVGSKGKKGVKNDSQVSGSSNWVDC